MFFITFITSVLTNCNQCDTTQSTEGNTKNKISSVAKKYFYFKLGSWWVYQNEISLERDSIYVVQNKLERIKGVESCKCDERIFVSYESTFNDSFYFYTESYSSPSITFNRISFGSSISYLTYRFRVQDDTSLSLTNQHNAIITFSPSYKGIKEEFKEVYRCFYNKALTDYLSNSYFAPKIGLIRYQYKNGDETYWNLVNYHVIQ